MDRLANMIAFVTVAETGSFAETASRLNLANSVVSKRIKDLEEYLGTPLLERTTRRVGLTDAGKDYAARSRRIIDELAEAEETLRHSAGRPVGDIKIAAPAPFARQFLGQALSGFLDTYPDVTITLSLRDGADDADVAICFTEPPEGMESLTLAQSRRVVVAAPSYLNIHGRPETPADLTRHNCFHACGDNVWPFKDGGQKIGGRYVADDETLLCDAAVHGCGIALLPTFIAGPHIVSGALEILLQDFETPPLDIRAAYPARNKSSVRVQKLLEHLQAAFSG